MTTCLFWNLNKKPLAPVVAQLIRQHNIDIACLAECDDTRPIVRALGKLLPEVPFSSPAHASASPSIQLLIRHTAAFWTPRIELFHGTIGEFKPPLAESFLLAAVHLPSRSRGTANVDSQCRLLANDIRSIESQIGHSRTVLVGDLNLDPFEDPVIEATGLHSVMTRQLARRRQRNVYDRSYEFFYNPMWSILGRGDHGPVGTYYYDHGGHHVRFWHTFDQVLIRPSLLDRFPTSSLQLLDSVGTQSLIDNNGHPNTRDYSDHLPIVFSID